MIDNLMIVVFSLEFTLLFLAILHYLKDERK